MSPRFPALCAESSFELHSHLSRSLYQEQHLGKKNLNTIKKLDAVTLLIEEAESLIDLSMALEKFKHIHQSIFQIEI